MGLFSKLFGSKNDKTKGTVNLRAVLTEQELHDLCIGLMSLKPQVDAQSGQFIDRIHQVIKDTGTIPEEGLNLCLLAATNGAKIYQTFKLDTGWGVTLIEKLQQLMKERGISE